MSWSNFDNSMQNEGGYMDATTTEGAAGDDKNANRGQNCVPVMIGHILKYGEALSIWGNPVKIANLVAIVTKIEATSTKVNFQFKDETGTLTGLIWLTGDNPEYDSPVKVRSYAIIHGLIRDQAGGEPYILVISIRPMTSLNELTTHLAEVTLVTLEGEKAQNAPSNANTSAAVDTVYSGMNAHQRMVLDIILKGDPEYGAERNAIKKEVPANVASKVDDILEFLSSEGHIYSTKTDDYFKAI